MSEQQTATAVYTLAVACRAQVLRLADPMCGHGVGQPPTDTPTHVLKEAYERRAILRQPSAPQGRRGVQG
jgi:hypothetical protein